MEIVTSIYGNCSLSYAGVAVISRKFLEYENTHENFESLRTFLGLSMLTATQLNAQHGGGMFARGGNADNADNVSLMNRNGSNINNGVGLGGAMTENPTEAPVGGGIAILVVAGVGYTLLKRKEDMQ